MKQYFVNPMHDCLVSVFKICFALFERRVLPHFIKSALDNHASVVFRLLPTSTMNHCHLMHTLLIATTKQIEGLPGLFPIRLFVLCYCHYKLFAIHCLGLLFYYQNRDSYRALSRFKYMGRYNT